MSDLPVPYIYPPYPIHTSVASWRTRYIFSLLFSLHNHSTKRDSTVFSLLLSLTLFLSLFLLSLLTLSFTILPSFLPLQSFQKQFSSPKEGKISRRIRKLTVVHQQIISVRGGAPAQEPKRRNGSRDTPKNWRHWSYNASRRDDDDDETPTRCWWAGDHDEEGTVTMTMTRQRWGGDNETSTTRWPWRQWDDHDDKTTGMTRRPRGWDDHEDETTMGMKRQIISLCRGRDNKIFLHCDMLRQPWHQDD